MIITNFKNLAKSPLRKKALQIIEAGYEAINIKKTVKNKIAFKNGQLIIKFTSLKGSKQLNINLKNYKKVFIIGVGKGSALASVALADILGKRLTEGIAVDVMKLKTWNLKLKTFIGTHPVPSLKNVRATKKIIELAKKAGKDDLIVSFICGGGSALLCGSQKELKASREIFNKLTSAGANIIKLNAIRKHLSEVKGGGLAKIAFPATMISLVVSDVIKNDLSMVASGPTIYDKTTKRDAERILKKYGLLSSATRNLLVETPKAKPRSERSSATGDKKYFKKVKNILFISNREPIAVMAEKAKKLGFSSKIYSYHLNGEAKNSLKSLMHLLPRGEVDGAVIAGGETTIKLGKNPGKGGRNMEAVLAALAQINADKNADKRRNDLCKFAYRSAKICVVSFASDGKDNTEAAGAIGDILTINKAQKLGLDFEKYLKNHSTFEFFKKTGDLIFADKKTFNVSDLMLILKI
ncbi:MAG: DUF4147 domain-containing protein [Spirochaetota bacterium]